jgi:hypothetical protein
LQAKALVQQAYRTDLYREAARHLELASPGRDYQPSNQHKTAWEIEPGIELSPDLLLAP